LVKDFDCLPVPGDAVITAEQLKIAKAREFARALRRLPFVRLIECRRSESPAFEAVAFETEVEIPQHPVRDIRPREILAVVFPGDASVLPDTLALRADFPLVPHLNSRSPELPRSLCVFEDAFPEFSFKWSPVRFLEDIRTWLARTARNELHQPNQPLEPLLEPGALELIFPPSILVGVENGDHLFLRHDLVGNARRSVFIREKVPTANLATMFAVYLKGTVQTHGVMRRKPETLAELQEFLKSSGIDAVGSTQRALREYSDKGGRNGSGTLLVLLLDLPKAREPGGSAQAVDQLAFVVNASVEELCVALGVSQRFNGNVGLLIGGGFGETTPSQLSVIPMRRLSLLTLESAAAFNGVEAVADSMAFVGLGALGSQVFMNLWRSGFGQWTLIDRDWLLPHNHARHALIEGVGESKAMAMADQAAKIFPDQVPKSMAADLLVPGSQLAELEAAFQGSRVVIDCSASVAVGRQLARRFPGGRRISAFLNPSGTDLVILAEPEDRSVRLDQLEMMYYRAILENQKLHSHLVRSDQPVRYSNACRDLSAVVAQDHIALHAAIASRAIRRFLGNPAGAIAIWRANPDGTVDRLDVPIVAAIEVSLGGWRIVFDAAVKRVLRTYRSRRLPNETGGVLLGAFDLDRKSVFVSDVLGSPDDSREWPTVYIRGSAGLRLAVQDAERLTQGGLEYVGEWHSHPDRFSGEASSTDKRALRLLSNEMGEDARPAVMFIVAQKEIRTYVEESKVLSDPEDPS
jgi:integrative and conjugative element protein (TIGR02256 family)